MLNRSENNWLYVNVKHPFVCLNGLWVIAKSLITRFLPFCRNLLPMFVATSFQTRNVEKVRMNTRCYMANLINIMLSLTHPHNYYQWFTTRLVNQTNLSAVRQHTTCLLVFAYIRCTLPHWSDLKIPISKVAFTKKYNR